MYTLLFHFSKPPQNKMSVDLVHCTQCVILQQGQAHNIILKKKKKKINWMTSVSSPPNVLQLLCKIMLMASWQFCGLMLAAMRASAGFWLPRLSIATLPNSGAKLSFTQQMAKKTLYLPLCCAFCATHSNELPHWSGLKRSLQLYLILMFLITIHNIQYVKVISI